MAWVAIGLVLAAIALAAATRPDLTGVADTGYYLQRAELLLARGQAIDHRFEPGYPFFLAVLIWLGLDPPVWVPVLQTALFLATLYLLLQAAAGRLVRRVTLLAVAATVSCVPTFLITANGPILTESLSASLIMLLLAALVRLRQSLVSERGRWRALGWLLMATSSSAYLGLTKGSFGYIHALYLPLVLAFLLFLARLRFRHDLVFFLAVAITCLAARGTASVWLSTGGLHRFDRGGLIVYGRAVRALQFDFRHDSVPFLLAALSQTACQRIYGERCERYRPEIEDEIGQAMFFSGMSDEELWRQGWQLVGHHPVLEVAFAPLTLTRLAVHHTTRGFATLEAPILGPISRGAAVTLLLKLLNLLVYIVPVLCGFVLHRHGGGLRSAWWGLPDEARVAILLAGAYCLAYLAVYSMAVVVLRMAYPIAVLPFICAIGTLAATWKAVAARRPVSGLTIGACGG